MNKPTPGWWRIQSGLGAPLIIARSNWLNRNREIAQVRYEFGSEDPEVHPNASLIVAAVNACFAINPDNPLAVAKALPEIITALKRIETGMSFPDDDIQRTARDVARAALAKLEAK